MIASLARWGKRDAMGQKLMTFVERMDAPTPDTFRIFLREACGFVLEALGKPSSNVPFIMPKRVADTDAFKQIEDYTGSGPYVFKKDEFKPGDKAVYVKNAKYVPRKEPPSGTAGGKHVYVDRVEWNLALRDGAGAGQCARRRARSTSSRRSAFEFYEPLKKDPNIQLPKYATVDLQYMARFNHLNKPFDNVKVRQAALAAFNQEPFLQAQVGVKELYNTCPSMFTCGTPYGSPTGSEIQSKSNMKKAQELLKASGYDGTPIVIMKPTDLAAIQKLPDVGGAAAAPGRLQGRPAGDGLEDAGRPAREEGPDRQGRLEHVPHRLAGPDIWNPIANADHGHARRGLGLVRLGQGRQAARAARAVHARDRRRARRRSSPTTIQVRAFEIGTHVPLGEYVAADGRAQEHQRLLHHQRQHLLEPQEELDPLELTLPT